MQHRSHAPAVFPRQVRANYAWVMAFSYVGVAARWAIGEALAARDRAALEELL